jgi:hypothetical protein
MGHGRSAHAVALMAAEFTADLLHMSDRSLARQLERGWTHMDDINARARLLAVEVLLAEPELLGNDALETDLYILRDKLRAMVS